MSLRTIARRACFSVAYRFYARPRLGRTDRARVMGYTLDVPPGVFHPGLFFSSKTFAHYLQEAPLEGKAVLDMGCGSGILSLVAAGRGASVTSIDINPAAAEATRVNASRARVRVRALCGNLFEPLGAGERFDTILFNPPFYTGNPKDMAAMAWHGGADYAIIRGFFSLAGRFVREAGSILLILSSDMEIPRVSGIARAAGFSMECVHTRALFFEELSVYEARLLP